MVKINQKNKKICVRIFDLFDEEKYKIIVIFKNSKKEIGSFLMDIYIIIIIDITFFIINKFFIIIQLIKKNDNCN